MGRRVGEGLCTLHLTHVHLSLVAPLYKGASTLVAQTVKNLSAMQETWVQTLGQEAPLENGMATHSIISPGKSHGQKSP